MAGGGRGSLLSFHSGFVLRPAEARGLRRLTHILGLRGKGHVSALRRGRVDLEEKKKSASSFSWVCDGRNEKRRVKESGQMFASGSPAVLRARTSV